jgi:hypothetical protein
MPKDEKPWEKVGLSRAAWYRKGKPTQVTQKPDAQLYTGDYGMQGARQITRQGNEYRVTRRKARKSKPSRFASGLSDMDASYVWDVYEQIAKHGRGVVHSWLIEFANALMAGRNPATAARSAAAESGVEIDGIDFDPGPSDDDDDEPEFFDEFPDVIEMP